MLQAAPDVRLACSGPQCEQDTPRHPTVNSYGTGGHRLEADCPKRAGSVPKTDAPKRDTSQPQDQTIQHGEERLDAPPFGGNDNAVAIARGSQRLLIDEGWLPIVEFSLPNGRRADIAALDPKGSLLIVEVKCVHAAEQ